jgi:hypothetical protein
LKDIRASAYQRLGYLSRTLTGQLQDSKFKPVFIIKKMPKDKSKKSRPIVSMNKEDREELWDEAYLKEEGIVIEFNPDTNTGKIKSLSDNSTYNIDSRELIRTKIELRPGDKVLFAPLEDPEGNDYARALRIIELNTKP